MVRKQIYLDEEIVSYLDNESILEHKSVSELIRNNIRKNISHNIEDLIQTMKKSAGIRKNESGDVEDYIRRLRRDRDVDA